MSKGQNALRKERYVAVSGLGINKMEAGNSCVSLTAGHIKGTSEDA